MSGGRFDYRNDYVCEDIFGVYPSYGLGNKEMDDGRRLARRRNPFENTMISELVFDVFCLIHSLDWYKSGDTGEDTYLEDVEYFSKKWLHRDYIDLAKTEVEKSIEELRGTLFKTFCLQEEESNAE